MRSAHLLRHPLFIAGLAIKLVFICFARPVTQSTWFLPFLTRPFSFDPWTQHLAAGGDILCFPYGPVMYLAYIPAMVALKLFALPEAAGHVFMGLTNLVLDFLLLRALTRLLDAPVATVLICYWLSPIVFIITYWHGQLDIVPVSCFVFSLLFLRAKQSSKAGAWLGLAIAAKLSMLIALPFITIFFVRNRRMQRYLSGFLTAVGTTLVLVQVPYFFSPGFTTIALGSREFAKITSLAIDFGNGQRVFLFPLTYGVLAYAAWRLERMSFDLFFAFSGVAFFVVLLLTPAPSGWYLWVTPFLAGFQVKEGRFALWLGIAFSVVYAATTTLFATGAEIDAIDLSGPLLDNSNILYSLFLTTTTGLGMLICIKMFTFGIRRNDYFRLSRRPLVIGIAGDSGTGKDTLGHALAGLFGSERVSYVSGDDYHKWERGAPMWNALTHLDPRANDLNRFTKDVLKLVDGRGVTFRRYDHKTGKFVPGQAGSHNDVIIVSGLHALYSPQLCSVLDTAIYLDMDDSLRAHFKVHRDVVERGKERSEVERSLQERRADRERYIRPQLHRADISFRLLPLDPTNVEHCVASSRFRLEIILRNGLYAEELVRTLIGLCGLYVDYEVLGETGVAKVTVDGQITPEDLDLVARTVNTNVPEFFADQPEWRDGMLGIMQLVMMHHVNDIAQLRLAHGS